MSGESSFYKNGPNNSYVYQPAAASFYRETAAFNLVYYGALSTAPTTDPFGKTILTGALYFDTTRVALMVFNGTTWSPEDSPQTAIEFIVDGGGSTPSSGTYGYLTIPFDCTIVSWTVLGDTTGSCQLDVQKCTFAQFNPPTHPASGDSITDSNKPALVSQAAASSAALGAWITNVTAGDIIGVSVISATTVKRITLSLNVIRR